MTQVLRVATLNIHKGLSQFNRRMVIHELREGLRALDADLVFLQEVQGMNERMALRFAAWPGMPQYEYLAEGAWTPVYGRNAVYDHGHHGNAILSRYPIVSAANEDVSSHRFERRGLLRGPQLALLDDAERRGLADELLGFVGSKQLPLLRKLCVRLIRQKTRLDIFNKILAAVNKPVLDIFPHTALLLSVSLDLDPIGFMPILA